MTSCAYMSLRDTSPIPSRIAAALLACGSVSAFMMESEGEGDVEKEGRERGESR